MISTSTFCLYFQQTNSVYFICLIMTTTMQVIVWSISWRDTCWSGFNYYSMKDKDLLLRLLGPLERNHWKANTQTIHAISWLEKCMIVRCSDSEWNSSICFQYWCWWDVCRWCLHRILLLVVHISTKWYIYFQIPRPDCAIDLVVEVMMSWPKYRCLVVSKFHKEW